ncbi:MAG: hypothetical protein HYY16_04225 [Planctomycetes bacterium]|nr:hypothetical protein [Planctomycetota bacterium]
MHAWATAALAGILLQDAPSEILVGTLQRHEQTGAFTVDDDPVTFPRTAPSNASFVGKRVQVVGRRALPEDPIEVAQIVEVEPPERDLVLDVEATGPEDARVEVEVREYYPGTGHAHAGSCRVHAWTRRRVDGERRAKAKIRLPAYKGGPPTRVYLRATTPGCAPAESQEFCWNAEEWVDADLAKVEGPRAVALALKTP